MDGCEASPAEVRKASAFRYGTINLFRRGEAEPRRGESNQKNGIGKAEP